MNQINFNTELFALCYNEEFLIPHFVSHYKNIGVTKFTFFDNGSTDKSVSIAKELGVEVIFSDTKDCLRDDIYLYIKNNCWKESSSYYVIVCDMDEFLEFDFDLTGSETVIKTQGYDMLGNIDSRLGVVNDNYSKCIMFSPQKINAINYTIGAHSCNPIGNIVYSEKTAKLLHRKYISEEVVLNKQLQYKKRLSELNKRHGWGSEYSIVSKEKIENDFKELNSKKINVDEYHARNF